MNGKNTCGKNSGRNVAQEFSRKFKKNLISMTERPNFFLLFLNVGFEKNSGFYMNSDDMTPLKKFLCPEIPWPFSNRVRIFPSVLRIRPVFFPKGLAFFCGAFPLINKTCDGFSLGRAA